jgi:hypothetical protein
LASKFNRLQFYNRPLSMGPDRWRWRLVARNGRIVAASSEGFTTRRDAERNFLRMMRMLRDPRLKILV